MTQQNRTRNSLQENLMQIRAVDRELRPFVAGVAPARLAEDELPEAVVETQLPRLHRDAREALLQAELGELAHAVRQQVHADAERLDFGRGLEHAAADARLPQRQREREAADAAADDENFHGRILPMLASKNAGPR